MVVSEGLVKVRGEGRVADGGQFLQMRNLMR